MAKLITKSMAKAIPFKQSMRAVAGMFLDSDTTTDPTLPKAVDGLSNFLTHLAPAGYPIGATAAAIDYGAMLVTGRPLHPSEEPISVPVTGVPFSRSESSAPAVVAQ